MTPQQVKTKTIWVRKSDLHCQVVFTALSAPESDAWYLDSGCSRHMTGNKALFTHLEDYNGGSVRFGDGGKAKVIGKGIVSIPGMTKLKEVYLVNGLKTNLLSISQLCDNSHKVHFSTNECIIVHEKGKTVLHGKRNPDNCYVVSTDDDMSCNSAVISNIDLWHQRLGHINHNDLEKISKLELVRGLPKLQKAANSVCGPCQVGKQI